MRAILARIVRVSQVDGKRKRRVDERERNSDEIKERVERRGPRRRGESGEKRKSQEEKEEKRKKGVESRGREAQSEHYYRSKLSKVRWKWAP